MALWVNATLVSIGIQFCLRGMLTGWAGIGFGPVHQTMDTYVGWITSSGTAVLQDGYSSSFDIPLTDATQSATIVSASQSAGMYQFCFTRPFQTTDNLDTKLVPGSSISVAWALHQSANPASTSRDFPYAQHTDRGVTTLDLPSVVGSTPPSTPAPTSAQETTSEEMFFRGDDNFYVSWRKEDKLIFFTYDCQVSGWVGIGFDKAQRIHQSTDTYISWVLSSGAGVVSL